MPTLIGPFSQILPLVGLPERGPIRDEQLSIIPDGGILVEGTNILAIGNFEHLRKQFDTPALTIEKIEEPMVALPGFVDAHTHLLYAGTRSRDFALRNAGSSYLEIKAKGGGIMDSVTATRNADNEELKSLCLERLDRLAKLGITTCEIKTGYGLAVDQELRMIKAIYEVSQQHQVKVIPCCLAAHLLPLDYQSNSPVANTDIKADYLKEMLEELLPKIKPFCQRVDAFVEPTAFPVETAKPYLKAAKEMGFSITVHADQFTCGGSQLAAEIDALSADHLEASGPEEIEILANSNTVAIALPGASLGLGMKFTPARQLLDAGAIVAIASDYNPGSAPMGDLLTQASILATYEKLSNAEVLAGITNRAARALGLDDRGELGVGKMADFIGFPTDDYREITYQQGRLRPTKTWINGKLYPN